MDEQPKPVLLKGRHHHGKWAMKRMLKATHHQRNPS